MTSLPTYYHIQVSTHANELLSSLDHTDLESVKKRVVAYLAGDDILLGGSTLRANQVKRLLVTESQDKSSECVNLAYSRMPVGAEHTVSPETCVFDNERFAKDITEPLIAELRIHPRVVKKQTAIEIWENGTTSQAPLDLKSTITNLYVTAKHLLELEAERRYRKFRWKFIVAGLIQYGIFVYFLITFDFHKVVHPAIIVIELTLHFLLVLLLLFGKDYEPRKYFKTKKAEILQTVYDDFAFKELDIRPRPID